MTNMQIVKVVVRGELPKVCDECALLSYNGIAGEWGYGFCAVYVERGVLFDKDTTRPTWCPLTLEDEEER